MSVVGLDPCTVDLFSRLLIKLYSIDRLIDDIIYVSFLSYHLLLSGFHVAGRRRISVFISLLLGILVKSSRIGPELFLWIFFASSMRDILTGHVGFRIQSSLRLDRTGRINHALISMEGDKETLTVLNRKPRY